MPLLTRSLIFALACLLCIGCASTCQTKITPLDKKPPGFAGHEDILETVFRHMCQPEPESREISHNVNPVHKVYFLSVGDAKDPSPELLQRLSDLKSPVKPLSAGRWKDFFIYDKISGERGAAFYVNAISMQSPDAAEVTTTTRPGGGLSASSYIYLMARKNGKWVVTGQKLNWIS